MRHQAPPAGAAAAEFAADVRFYLERRPRQLPSRYLYDALGSALFDAICHLPWYRVTRRGNAPLEEHAAEILGALRPLRRVVELGTGNGDKLAALHRHRTGADRDARLHLVDVSGAR